MKNWFTKKQKICVSSTNRTPVKHSIGLKLLRYVFGVYCIFTILITGFHMVYEYFREKDVLKADLVLQQGIFENSLAHAVWHLDKTELTSTVSGILKLPQIIGVSIHSPQGQIIYRQGLVDDFEKNNEKLSVFQNNQDNVTELHFKAHLMQHHFSLLSEQYETVESLGKTYFYTSSEVIINRVKDGFISIIVAAVFKTLLLWFVFLYFSHLFLSMPLSKLINKMIELPLEYTKKKLFPIIKKGRNEIDLLVEVFDEMMAQLEIAITALQQDFQKQKSTSNTLQQELAVTARDMTEINNLVEQLSIAKTSSEAANQTLREAIKVNEKQHWLKTGETQLHDQMQKVESLEELTRRVVTFLAGYINAYVGVLFIMDGDTLKLAASYAFKSRAGKNNYKLGEGLVGQTAKEKKTIIFDHVPDNHFDITISSGVGESKPKSIYFIPLLYDDNVKGVMSFGTNSKCSDRDIEFLDGVASRIAIEIHTTQAKKEMETLLALTQQQFKKMQTRPEELRELNG